jgi:aminoglycoside/choline kinase family phosphotransferase
VSDAAGSSTRVPGNDAWTTICSRSALLSFYLLQAYREDVVRASSNCLNFVAVQALLCHLCVRPPKAHASRLTAGLANVFASLQRNALDSQQLRVYTLNIA